ncbi:unnamed protein product [Sphagnum balticum]|jgi:hypothetical protein
MRQRMRGRRNKFHNRRNGRGRGAGGQGGRGKRARRRGGKRGGRQGGKGGKNREKNSTPSQIRTTSYRETPAKGGGATNEAYTSGAQTQAVTSSSK